MLLDSETGEESTYPHAGFVETDFSPDGSRMAFAEDDSTVAVVDLESKEIIGRIAELGRAVRGFAFSPDARMLYVAGNPSSAWDLTTFTRVDTLTLGSAVSIAASADGKWMALDEGIVPVHSVEMGEIVHEIDPFGKFTNSILFAQDAAGRDVLITNSHAEGPAAERRVEVWDLETQALRMMIPTASGPAVVTGADGQPLIVLSREDSAEIRFYEIPLRPGDATP